jgi:asparagine synthase (glutamine-hydrolysing)
MCGVAGSVGGSPSIARVERMIDAQRERGPDDRGVEPLDDVVLGHARLSIVDLSPRGHQPMHSADGRYVVVFNGEIYNFHELTRELGFTPRSGSDTEVLLEAWARWGEGCLDRFVGMFAFALYDRVTHRLVCARDRFGVKPLHHARLSDGTFVFASSIRALHAAGVPAEHDADTWATYLARGVYDDGVRTFWRGIERVPPGHVLTVHDGHVTITRWYSAEEHSRTPDTRSDAVVIDDVTAHLQEAVRLRLIADVPVGVCLSGGLDSSLLVALLSHAGNDADALHAFTFATGDERYDELPWVHEVLRGTRHPHHVVTLTAAEVPELARQVMAFEDEPFGGLPTLAMSKLFAAARAVGCKVLLDGQGVDESFAGYDSYARVVRGETSVAGAIQGSATAAGQAHLLSPAMRARVAVDDVVPPMPGDALRAAQLRDLERTKLPRALRFNDRASMMHSVELREPFLDHRLVELGLRQPSNRKVRGDVQKWVVREAAQRLLPGPVLTAPKRPVQTPQREWLRGPLSSFVDDCLARIQRSSCADWLEWPAVHDAWAAFRAGHGDNSFFVWQWISLALALELQAARQGTA